MPPITSGGWCTRYAVTSTSTASNAHIHLFDLGRLIVRVVSSTVEVEPIGPKHAFHRVVLRRLHDVAEIDEERGNAVVEVCKDQSAASQKPWSKTKAAHAERSEDISRAQVVVVPG